ncbi:MAG: tetratricopeptide repeat protein [Pirellulaceae bacterium]
MSGSSNSSPSDLSRRERWTSALREFAQDIWLGMKHRPIRTASILGTVVASAISLGIGLQRLTPPALNPHDVMVRRLEQALEELDAGRYESARRVAADLRLHPLPPERQGVPPYVLGQVMRHDALMGEWQERERRSLHLLAARYLEETRRAGFPAGRESEGMWALCRSLHACRRFAEALPHLHALLKLESVDPAEVHRLLADCYLNDRKPNLEKASEHIQRYLEQPSLPAEDRDEALLTQARILFQLSQWDACQRVIDQLSQTSGVHGDAVLLAARLQMREGDRLAADPDPKQRATAHEKYASALDFIEKAAQENVRADSFRRQQQYLLGIVYRRMGDYLAAEDQLARTARSYLDSVEGIAAGIEHAELQQLLGNDASAIDSFRRTVRKAVEIGSHGEPWLTDDEIRRRVESVVAKYTKDDRFTEAIDLADALYALFPDARTVQLQAAIHKQTAQHLAAQAEEKPMEADALLAKSRTELRHAGRLFEQLARLRFASRDYANDLWESGENYLAGQDYDSAARMYTRFLNNDTRNARPAALVRLGEVDMARNDPVSALKWLDECIEYFPKTPFVYRARWLAAQASLERGDALRAKDLLAMNLDSDALTPASHEWRESLFLMGHTMFEEGMRHEAQSRLKGVDSTIASERQAGLAELRQGAASFN